MALQGYMRYRNLDLILKNFLAKIKSHLTTTCYVYFGKIYTLKLRYFC